MKPLKLIIIFVGIVTLSSLFGACTKETPNVGQPQTNFTIVANVQVFNATVKAAHNYVYVDGAPVSGAALAYGGVFPGTAYSFIVNPGARNFLIKDTSSVTSQVPLNFTQNMDEGKSYTIFTYDSITNIQQLTVTNNITIPKDTSCMLRFGNFIYNATSVPNVDVYSYRRGATTPVFSNVATASVTNFIPYAAGITDTLYVYATGTTSPLLVKALVPTLTQTRSYTSVYSGSYTGKQAIATFATY